MDEVTEKERRVYYQTIVYNVCKQLDEYWSHTAEKDSLIVCGTLEHPSTEVQDCLEKVLAIQKTKQEIKRPTKITSGFLFTIPFGMHKGKTINEVPLKYLDWLLTSDLNMYGKQCIKHYLSDPTIKRELEKELANE